MQQAMNPRRLEDMIKQVQSGSMKMSEKEAIAIAVQLYSSGRYAQAVEVCRQIISRKPELADAHSILGVSLNAQGQVVVLHPGEVAP